MTYFRSIQTKHQPVQWMMTSITYINRNTSKGSIKYWVSCVALHVVGGFVKISDTGNMILSMFTKHCTIRVDHHAGVPDRITVSRISLQNRRNYYHVVLLGENRQKLGRDPSFGILGKLAPRIFLPRTKSERHSCNNCTDRLLCKFT